MTEIGISVGSVLVFIFGTIIIGSKIVPRIVNFIGRLNKPDLLIITILGIVFTLSYIAYEIGISIATGAFFAGVLIAGSKVQVVTKVMATPIRDMFAAALLCFCWCTDGYHPFANIYYTCNYSDIGLSWGKINCCVCGS